MGFRSSLEAALARLKADGIIKSNGDIMKSVGLTARGALSAYVSGKTEISEAVKTKFENKYNLRLADFDHLVTKNGAIAGEKNKKTPEDQKDLRELIEVQKKLISTLTEERASLLEQIAVVQKNQITIAYTIEGRLQVLLEYVAQQQGLPLDTLLDNADSIALSKRRASHPQNKDS